MKHKDLLKGKKKLNHIHSSVLLHEKKKFKQHPLNPKLESKNKQTFEPKHTYTHMRCETKK